MAGEIAEAYVQLKAQGGPALHASVAGATQGLDGPMGGKGKLLGAALAGGVAVGVGAAAVGIGKALTSAMDFDLVIRQVGVASGTTGKQLDALRQYALDMGQQTAFSASEAGAAMLELSKSGLTAAEIKGGALATTLDLASAGNLELAEAAGYVTSAMGQYGLGADEAARASAALAGAANASKADVADIGQALAQVGTVADNTGLSVEETTAALAAMSKAGVEGSDAGTSLKTMLSRLVPSTKEAALEMERYGLNFVKRNGEYKDMSEIAGELEQGLGKLSDSERNAALQTIFGADAVRAATVVMKQGKGGIEELTKATSDNAALQDMAKTKTEGAAGALDAFKGSVETLGISVGSKLLPAFTNVTEGATGLVNGLTDVISGKGTPFASDGLQGTVFGAMVQGGQDALDAGREVWGGMKRGWDDLSGSLSGVAEEHGPMIEMLVDGASDVSGAIFDVLGPALGWLTEEGFGMLGTGIERWTDGMKVAGNVAFDLAGAVLAIGPPILSTFAGIANAALTAGIAFAEAQDAMTPGDQSGPAEFLRGIRDEINDTADTFADNAPKWSAALNEQQRQWNLTASEAAELGNRIKALPDSLETTVTTPGAVKSIADVSRLAKQYKLTPDEIVTVVEASGVQMTGRQVALLAKQYKLTPKQVATLIKTTGTATTLGDLRKVLKQAGITDKQDVKTVLKTLGTKATVDDLNNVRNKAKALDGFVANTRINVNGASAAVSMISGVAAQLRSLDGASASVSVLGGRRAAGGPVDAGTPYLVGERGPEIFAPAGAGRILSAHATTRTLRGAGGGTVAELTITNWKSGKGYFRQIAAEEVGDAGDFAATVGRMGTG